MSEEIVDNNKNNKNTIEIQFQRDLNKILDNDRSIRKNGLTKLLNNLPWNNKKSYKELKSFIFNNVYYSLINLISDPIEKCRELALLLFKKILLLSNKISYNKLYDLTLALCGRINSIPFEETAEELRLLIIELLLSIQSQHNSSKLPDDIVTNQIYECILQAIIKSLTDNFPAVKRSSAELMCLLCQADSNIETANDDQKPMLSTHVLIRSYYKQLLKSLLLNITHQHSKTRAVTLQAIGQGLCCVIITDYMELMKEVIIPALSRIVSDRTAIVRIELAVTCSSIFSHRVRQCIRNKELLTSIDYELLVLLLLLHGDEVADVESNSKNELFRTLSRYAEDYLVLYNQGVLNAYDSVNSSNMDIDDAEATLQNLDSAAPSNEIDGNQECSMQFVNDFITVNFRSILHIILDGANGWTTDARRRYLKGIKHLLSYCAPNELSMHLSSILTTISGSCRDEEIDVRTAAEECCQELGRIGSCSNETSTNLMQDILEIIIPRIAGLVDGGDTAQQRANAIQALTYILKGTEKEANKIGIDESQVCGVLTTCLSQSSLHLYRDASIRESLVLFVRTILQTFPTSCTSLTALQKSLLLTLLFLCSKLPGEGDIIADAACRELRHFAALACGSSNEEASDNVEKILSQHFQYLLFRIVTITDSNIESTSEDIYSTAKFYEEHCPRWDADSPGKATFEVLINEANSATWNNHTLVFAIMTPQVQPPTKPADGSAEANAQMYAAQRGEENIPHMAIVDVRLSLLALTEGMLRVGASKWENSKAISAACEVIIRKMIIPNLVWRVGRVEATVRKVALAVCYGILKAGAIKMETLFAAATELVPLIVSHLDDSDTTPRQMACLCLTVVFDRLRGVFSEQSIREIYPKLVARLDDSNDVVRIAVCTALDKFLQCGASPDCYSSTTIDYTLDQLFVHLDDPSPDIQEAVFQVILQVANLDKDRVMKKANENRCNHRTPHMCDKVIVEVQGFEILK